LKNAKQSLNCMVELSFKIDTKKDSKQDIEAVIKALQQLIQIKDSSDSSQGRDFKISDESVANFFEASNASVSASSSENEDSKQESASIEIIDL